MDYRIRRYFLVRLGRKSQYEENLNKLKTEIKSLKIHKPYYHFVDRKESLIKSGSYDGYHVISTRLTIGRYQMMISCRIEESEKIENLLLEFMMLPNIKYIEFTKELLGN